MNYGPDGSTGKHYYELSKAQQHYIKHCIKRPFDITQQGQQQPLLPFLKV